MSVGFGPDDKWRMVEDELLETAKVLTQSLRQEEYKRLMDDVLTKKIPEDRLVTGTSSDGISQMIINGERYLKSGKVPMAKRRAKTTAKTDSSEDDNEAPWMKDDCLAELMTYQSTHAKEIPEISRSSISKGAREVPRLSANSCNDHAKDQLPPNVDSTSDNSQESESDWDDLDCCTSTNPVHTIAQVASICMPASRHICTSENKRDHSSHVPIDFSKDKESMASGLNISSKLNDDERRISLKARRLSLKKRMGNQDKSKSRNNKPAIGLQEIPTFLV